MAATSTADGTIYAFGGFTLVNGVQSNSGELDIYGATGAKGTQQQTVS